MLNILIWPAHFSQPKSKRHSTCEILCFEVQIIEFVDVVYTSLPCSVQSYRILREKQKSATMDNFSTIRLAGIYPLLCLKFHVLNQEKTGKLFLYVLQNF